VPVEIKPTTPLSLAIYTRMKDASLSSKQLANGVDVHYETMRGILKGDRPPTKRLLRDICRVLTMDFEDMNEMLITEQMKRKFGRVPAPRKNDPELRSIEEAWPSLLPDEKEHIILLVERYVVQKQRQQFVAPTPRILPRPVRKP
jgi:DNA-binding XRE family transcriptional regulator